MRATVTELDVTDVRFPTSRQLDGSDAMHPDPDYSAAYVVLRTDAPGVEGHGLCFTIGRGNDVIAAAVRALAPFVTGRPAPRTAADLATLGHAHGVPVCPHAGGVGLCELVQHLAMFDYVAVSGSQEGRVIEYVDHLHEHFVHPAVIESGHYRTPETPGFCARMRPESLAAYRYPDGPVWHAGTTTAAPQGGN